MEKQRRVRTAHLADGPSEGMVVTRKRIGVVKRRRVGVGTHIEEGTLFRLFRLMVLKIQTNKKRKK